MSVKTGGSSRLLHIHGSLAAENPQAERCVRIINALGGQARHTMVSFDGDYGALDRLARAVPVERHGAFPAVAGLPTPGKLQRMARVMVDYHLILTYGRGGIVAALAHTMFSDLLGLPPLIHHEDGSDETARERAGLRSNWYRRVGLGKAAGLVVPTEPMEHEALVRWQQPFGRVKTIPDGVDLDQFRGARKGEGIPRLVKRPGERWIGCEARFAASADTAPLLAVLADLDPAWHLILVGDGPARAEVAAKVSAQALDHRVHFVPELSDRRVLAKVADIVVAAPHGPFLPQGILDAMAAGKPVVGFETGALAANVSADNVPFVVEPARGEGAFSDALQQLALDDFLRRRIGEANRERAEKDRDARTMIAAYRRLYASAMGRDNI